MPESQNLLACHCIRIRPEPTEIQLRSAGVELGRWSPFLAHVTAQANPLAIGQPAGMSVVLAYLQWWAPHHPPAVNTEQALVPMP